VAPIAAARETLSYPTARERVLAAVRPLPAEEVPLEKARGRALARDVVAAHALPPFRNASMDGIAVRSEDLSRASASAPIELPVAGEIAAGATPPRALRAGECWWIMTGAMLPEGADAVVPIEEVESVGGKQAEHARLRGPCVPGLNVRHAGADLEAGATALPGGRELSVHDIALLAALGVTRPHVGGQPLVAAFSTGDELLDVGAALRPGKIRDSNLPMLSLLLEECGARVVSVIRLPDDPVQVSAAIESALQKAHVVITLGGVSAGRHDPVKLGIEQVSGVALWQVAMKPGRPQAFGAPGGRLFFGMPGNPASVACVFEALVRPALRKLQGFASLDRPRLTVHAAHAIESRAGRTDFVRVTLEPRGESWWAHEAGSQVSGHLTPQARAHGLLMVGEERSRLETGDTAPVLILRWPDPA
jgi:molybdopterin molybdotransferase